MGDIREHYHRSMPRFVMVCAVALLATASSAPGQSPYARKDPLRIQSIARLAGPKVQAFGRMEFVVGLSATYDNPFDPGDFTLDAIIRTPSGKRLEVPGFLYRPYTRTVGPVKLPIAYSSTEAAASGKVALTQSFKSGEILALSGQASWRVRFTPSETGRYTFLLVARDRTGTVRSKPISFAVAGKANSGFVRVSSRDKCYFAFDDGKPYFPFGANACWAGERGTRDYEAWFPAFGKSGANWSRLWLSPNWVTFALERSELGIGQFDLANAWRLDYVLDLAERNGLYLNLCVDSYNVLRDKINWPEWERSPQNKANGGPLANPTDFWTDDKMARLYRAKLRYLVARYGWSTHVMAWELWNEVDGTADYKPAPVVDWHRRMAQSLRSLDPYRHLVSTSFGMFGADRGDSAYFSMPELDFSQAHIYDAPDLAGVVVDADERMKPLGKPAFVAELGADTGGAKADDDPDGMQIHDPMWAALTSGSSGGSMAWWWDSYIAPRNLYGLYAAASRFVDGIGWDRESFRTVTPVIVYADLPNPLPLQDVVIEGGPAGFSPSPTNRAHTVRIDESGVTGKASGILHGIGNHAPLHNPVTFQTDLSRPTRLVVEVSSVSGYGGAGLTATLDGTSVMQKSFPDPDGDRITDDLKQYAGDYAVDIPAGRHSITIENTGQDWILAGFRFNAARVRKTPPLVSWATVGKRTVLAWVRLEERTWRRMCRQKAILPPCPASILNVRTLRPGIWRCEIWDTWTGRVASTRNLMVGPDSLAHISLPPIDKDLAVKLVFVEQARRRP